MTLLWGRYIMREPIIDLKAVKYFKVWTFNFCRFVCFSFAVCITIQIQWVIKDFFFLHNYYTRLNLCIVYWDSNISWYFVSYVMFICMAVTCFIDFHPCENLGLGKKSFFSNADRLSKVDDIKIFLSSIQLILKIKFN